MKDVHINAGSLAAEILTRARRMSWKDFDPYDGLSGWGGDLPDHPMILKRVMTQLVMRTSPTLRPLFGVGPHSEAYTLGVLLSTAIALGEDVSLDQSSKLAEEILGLRLTDEGAWGYGFPVVTRAAQYLPEKPNVISTVFAGLGLLDWIEARGSSDEVENDVNEARQWLTEVSWDRDERIFQYHDGNREVIYNASILAALMLARGEDILGFDTQGIVAQATDRVLEAQRGDGAWPYGEGPKLSWVDNHHTGFILKALLLMPERHRPENWEQVVRQGLNFYAVNLIASDGRPISSTTSEYPADSLAAGQAIETLALAAEVLHESSLAHKASLVFGWTEQTLRRRDGRFRFRRGRYLPWPGAYLRWGEAHIALGAARLSRIQE